MPIEARPLVEAGKEAEGWREEVGTMTNLAGMLCLKLAATLSPIHLLRVGMQAQSSRASNFSREALIFR